MKMVATRESRVQKISCSPGHDDSSVRPISWTETHCLVTVVWSWRVVPEQPAHLKRPGRLSVTTDGCRPVKHLTKG